MVKAMLNRPGKARILIAPASDRSVFTLLTICF